MTRRRGPTTAVGLSPADQAGDSGQLALDWVPPASAATTDFVCWLWAAFPPRDGKLNISKIAKTLEVSTTTLRRWIAKDDPKLRNEQIRRLHQRAILRGKGHYLWPDLDPATRRRSELVYADAMRNDELIRTEPERVAPTWRKNGTLDPHVVQIVFFPKAHVYGVSAATHEKAQAKVHRLAEVIESTVVPNKFAAIALKHEILTRVDVHRCITPRHLAPTGRTETWRETGGPTTIHRPLEVAVVRFSGLDAYRKVVEQLHNRLPLAHVNEHVVDDAGAACAALASPADVVVLASTGWTRTTWGTARRPWPGGRWYVGGRGFRAAGLGLSELVAGVGAAGGFHAPLVVIAAGQASAGRSQLRELGGGRSRVLLQVAARRGAADLSELQELLEALSRHRAFPWRASRGLKRYVPA